MKKVPRVVTNGMTRNNLPSREVVLWFSEWKGVSNWKLLVIGKASRPICSHPVSKLFVSFQTSDTECMY